MSRNKNRTAPADAKNPPVDPPADPVIADPAAGTEPPVVEPPAGNPPAGNPPPADIPPPPVNDPPPADGQKAGKKCKARVLVSGLIDGELRQPDDVITVDAVTLERHADQLDPNPAAVKYAESLKDSAED